MRGKSKVTILVLVIIVILLTGYSFYLHSSSKGRKVAEIKINNILSQKDYKQVKELSYNDEAYNFLNTLLEIDTKEVKCLLATGNKRIGNIDQISIELIVNTHPLWVVLEPKNVSSFWGKLFPKWEVKSIIMGA